jgi:hypothetical protein
VNIWTRHHHEMSEGNIAESSTATFRAAASAPTPKPQAHTSTVPQAAASSGDARNDEESDEETDAVDIKTLRSFNESVMSNARMPKLIEFRF